MWLFLVFFVFAVGALLVGIAFFVDFLHAFHLAIMSAHHLVVAWTLLHNDILEEDYILVGGEDALDIVEIIALLGFVIGAACFLSLLLLLFSGLSALLTVGLAALVELIELGLLLLGESDALKGVWTGFFIHFLAVMTFFLVFVALGLVGGFLSVERYCGATEGYYCQC